MEIIDLAKQLERIKLSSKDLVAPTNAITAVEDGGTLKIDLKDHGMYPLTKWGKQQLAEKTDIPIRYFNKMLDTGKAKLAAENVNSWLAEEADARLVRISDNHIRAILSDRYRPMDNMDVAVQVMDRVKEHNGQILDAQLTEQRMYIKALSPEASEYLDFTDEERKAHTWHNVDKDTLIPGIIVSNSEVGSGAFRVEPLVFRGVCSNTVITTDTLYKIHVGGRLELGIYKEDTLRANDRLLWSQTRDLIDGTFNKDLLHKHIAQLRDAKQIAIPKPIEAVNVVSKDLTLSEDRKNDLLRYFSKESDTVFGLVNGITRLAQDFKDFDDRVSVERYAGKRLEELAPILAQ